MSDSKAHLIQQIDALLPQTQCELCEYPGCLPYATAIANDNEQIDRCLPGGVNTLMALGKLLHRDPKPFIAALAEKSKAPSKVVIDESRCIGCTKCLPVCPTDAIIGSGKRMHTVIADACTGCDRCIPACPVDCISSIASEAVNPSKQDEWRQRFQAHQQRLQNERHLQRSRYQKNKQSGDRQQQLSDRLAKLNALKRQSKDI